jgi:IMP dehydrogenase
MGFENKFYSQHKSLSFNDVLIQPTATSLVESRLDVDLTTKLTPNIMLQIPIIASPMDKVVNLHIAQLLRSRGGVACFHRFQTIESQLSEILQYKQWCVDNSHTDITVAAISAQYEDDEEIKRIKTLAPYVHAFVIDTAMGTNIKVLRSIEWIKRNFPAQEIIAGNIVNVEGAMTLINAGADSIRAGIGGGSACLTRIQTGCGRGQLTVLIECADVCKKHNVSLISDGGVSTPGDFAKALAAGADVAMMGAPLAGHEESPGEVYYKYSDHYFKGNDPIYLPGIGTRLAQDVDGLRQYKLYRGMASKELQQDWRGGLKLGTTYEGLQKYVESKGLLIETITNFTGGLRSSMSYCDSKTIGEFHQKAKFEKLSIGSQKESYDRSSN